MWEYGATVLWETTHKSDAVWFALDSDHQIHEAFVYRLAYADNSNLVSHMHTTYNFSNSASGTVTLRTVHDSNASGSATMTISHVHLWMHRLVAHDNLNEFTS